MAGPSSSASSRGTSLPEREDAAVAVFVALADPTRRHLLDTLARKGPATVTELADGLPISRQAVAKHLAQLADAGLVEAGDADGRRVPYRLRPEPMRDAHAWLGVLANQWDDRLSALQSHLEGP
ncbi:MAG: transcriptional regulator, ArsR family [Actinomycetia bacterium]|nr:transcriptional regulator, ArsR family [Actinomycetes bacterium]